MSVRYPLAWLAVVFVLQGLTTVARSEAEPRDGPSDPLARQLFQAALQAELAGNVPLKDAILATTLHRSPDYAPARWLGGYLQVEDHWRSISSLEYEAAADPQLEAYRSIRQELVGTPGGHEALARWCRRKGLPDQERAHWTQVHRLNPDHHEAREQLGLRSYRGQWRTLDEIERIQRAERRSHQVKRRLVPQLTQWVRDYLQGDSGERETAWYRLCSISDPDAIAAAEEVMVWHHASAQVRKLAKRFGTDQAQQIARQLHSALIRSLSAMPDHAATVALVRHAVLPDDLQIRYLAIDGLKKRPLTNYVPLLMNSMTTARETDVEYRGRDGSVLVHRVEGPLAIFTFKETRLVRPGPAQRVTTAPQAANGRKVDSRTFSAAFRSSPALNSRVQTVLRQVTGADMGSDPRPWWQWWKDYNELDDSGEKPIYASHYLDVKPPPPPHECFVLGTPVWTETGLRPIESIEVGDRVLAQDPRSGELAYKPILQTTYRPPSPMVRLVLPSDTITATRGHRFWQVGQGWRMAKFLTPEMRLCGATQSLLVEKVEPADSAPAYNLVVADFHTYFVGQYGLLSHDNLFPEPTTAALPGYSRLLPSLGYRTNQVGVSGHGSPPGTRVARARLVPSRDNLNDENQ